MSDISEQIDASITLADFVSIDSIGKANIVGGGIRILPIDPNSKLTAPFGILVALSAPLAFDDSPAFEILLTTATGALVQLPGTGGNQPLRVSQNIDFASPSVHGMSIPKGALPSTVLFAINFNTGLPLKGGNSYQFRAQIDHDVVASYSIFVPRANAGAVLG